MEASRPDRFAVGKRALGSYWTETGWALEWSGGLGGGGGGVGASLLHLFE
jgi:hypothetical protein